MDEIHRLAADRDGFITSKEAREVGIADSVLVRLAQRGKLERLSRGVYRPTHYPADRWAQYREAILWAKASSGPELVVLSHETALLLYGISDVNPPRVHITVPIAARLRRAKPSWIVIHRADLLAAEIGEYEGIPVTKVDRSVLDVLTEGYRVSLARQAIADALGRGLLNSAEARKLRAIANRSSHTRPS